MDLPWRCAAGFCAGSVEAIVDFRRPIIARAAAVLICDFSPGDLLLHLPHNMLVHVRVLTAELHAC
jgi:hypothetical protein